MNLNVEIVISIQMLNVLTNIFKNLQLRLIKIHTPICHTHQLYTYTHTAMAHAGGVRTLKVLHISVLIKGYYQHLGCTTYPILVTVNFSDAQTDAHFVRIDITVINPNLRQSLCNNVIGAQDRNTCPLERTIPLHYDVITH